MRGADIAAISALLPNFTSPATDWRPDEEATKAPSSFFEPSLRVAVIRTARRSAVIGCTVLSQGGMIGRAKSSAIFPDLSRTGTQRQEHYALAGGFIGHINVFGAGVPSESYFEDSSFQEGSWYSELERLTSELGRLQIGWAGPETLPPTQSVLRDLDVALVTLDCVRSCPKAEVDSSDGSVSLIWDSGEESFSLVFNGNGKVIGVLSPYRENYPPWEVSVENDSGLAEKLESSDIADFVDGQ